MKYLFLLLFCVLSFSCSSNIPEKTKIEIGDDVVIQSNGITTTVATDEETFMKLVEAGASKDKEAFDVLVFSGKVFSVESGTKACVINNGIVSKVRLIDGKFEGQYVWLDRSWLKPLNKK